MAERTDAQRKAEAKYKKRAYDMKLIQMPKGSLAILAELAAEQGVTVNRYILEAVEARSGRKFTLDGVFPEKKAD